jgi:hypothetical protein
MGINLNTTPPTASSIPIGTPTVQLEYKDLAELKKFAVDFQGPAVLGGSPPAGLTREQVMAKGGLAGAKPGFNLDFTTATGTAIWESFAGADGLLSAREHAAAILVLDAKGTNTADGKLTKADLDAGFAKILADSKTTNGIAKTYQAFNQVAENVNLDDNNSKSSKFLETAGDVAAAKNMLAGSYWGTLAPKNTVAGSVASNQNSSIWGDPHIADADRANQDNLRTTSFNIGEEGDFNLLKDKNTSLTGTFEKFKNWGLSVTTKTNLDLGADHLTIDAGVAKVNGTVLKDGDVVSLTDGTKITLKANQISVKTPESSEYDFNFGLAKTTEKETDKPINYINTDVFSKSQGVFADGQMPTGILGEGFDADFTERKALKNPIDSYRITNILPIDEPVPTTTTGVTDIMKLLQDLLAKLA